MRKNGLAPLLTSHRVVVCVGSGGVGKTTTAASLALWGALRGRRTAVVTIDPAKRLADCLGISASQQQETPLPPERFTPYGIRPSGTLTALLVDQQGAWDAAITRYAPTAEIRDRVLANRFYQGLSRSFAGSHEYMALDTLATMVQRNTYDLIVVDTPPVQQALDFLEAPQRLQRFLGSQARKWFLQPSPTGGWAAVSVMRKTTAFILKKVEEATGISTLREITEFFSSMQQMFDDFGARFQRVRDLLTSDETGFVLVTSPDEEVLREAEEFHRGLTEVGVTLRGAVVNRVHERWGGKRVPGKDKTVLANRLRRALGGTAGVDPQAIDWVIGNFFASQAVAEGETRRIEQFAQNLSGDVPVVEVPILPAFPADLGGLLLLHRYLFPVTTGQGSRLNALA